MFAERFYGDRMFAPRYFPKVGAALGAVPDFIEFTDEASAYAAFTAETVMVAGMQSEASASAGFGAETLTAPAIEDEAGRTAEFTAGTFEP